MRVKNRIERDAVMIGRVCVPTNTDRQEYVEYCLRNHVVGVMMPNGDYLRECPIAYPYIGEDDGMICGFDFPPNAQTLGSSVVLVTTPQTSQGIVIGCITPKNPKFPLTEEEQAVIKKSRTDDDGYRCAEVNIKGFTGIIDILADSDNDKEGKVRIRARNGSDTGEIELKADVYKKYISKDEFVENKGNVTRNIKGTLEETVEEAFNMTVSDPSTWEFEDDLTVHSQSTAKFDADTEVLLGSSGHQPVLLGDDTVDALDDTLGYIGDIAQELMTAFAIPIPPTGLPSGLSTAGVAAMTALTVQVSALQAQLTLLKSQKVKTE
jgi:hypothetical protein